MAYFAELDDENCVIQVISISNDVCPDPAPDNEQLGIHYIVDTLGLVGTWRQTSFHSSFRKNYASIGGTYSPDLDAFIGPQPYPSWILNETSCQWQAPVPLPNESGVYAWDEQSKSWERLGE